MKSFICLCWFTALVVLLSLGFETIIWRLLIPVTVTLVQLDWLELAVNLTALVCSLLFIALTKFFGDKL